MAPEREPRMLWLSIGFERAPGERVVSQIMKAKGITSTSEQVALNASGPIVAVRFAGKYPPGSEGNASAAEMVNYLRSVLVATDAAAVLFDFQSLQYTWGDVIGALAWALLTPPKHVLPSAIVAQARTARALAPLLCPQFAFGIVGTRMFDNTPEALEHLQQMLAQQTG